MKEILVTIPVEPQHKIYLENAVADYGESGFHFTYTLQNDVTQKMVRMRQYKK